VIASAAVAATAAVLAGLGADGDQRPAARATANGVTVDVDHHRGATVTIGSPRTRRIVQRGGEMTVTCAYRSTLFPSPQLDRAELTWRRGQTTATVRRLRRGYQFCSIGVRYEGRRGFATLADVPLSPAGRKWIDERDAADRAFANLQKIVIVEAERGGKIPPAEQMGYTALATPDALPAPEQIGVFIDAAVRRIRVVVLTRAGAPVFMERAGSEFRTNTPQWVVNR
jgi:hypothetical protein